jgi:RHS repeat-associated protein
MTISAVCASTTLFSSSRSTGKERDTESGNDYFGARYYSSSYGRFMSPDWSAKEEPVPYAKLDDPQSLNLYAYVRNNPVTRRDPDGHLGCGFLWLSNCPATPPPPPQPPPQTPASNPPSPNTPAKPAPNPPPVAAQFAPGANPQAQAAKAGANPPGPETPPPTLKPAPLPPNDPPPPLTFQQKLAEAAKAFLDLFGDIIDGGTKDFVPPMYLPKQNPYLLSTCGPGTNNPGCSA